MTIKPQRSVLIALLWMVGAAICFSMIAVSARGLSAKLTVFESLALRNLGGLILLFVLMPLFKGQIEFRPFRFDLHLLRNLIHYLAQAAWIYALLVLPLSFVFALEFTTPAWTAVFAFLFLRELLSLPRLVSIALGFIGALVIVRPGLQPVQLATLMGLLAAVGFGAQIAITKKLTANNSTWAILLWMNIMQFPLNIITNALTGGEWLFFHKIEMSLALPLIGISLFGVLAHLCLTNAFHYGDAVIIAPMDFLRVPIVSVVAFVLYGEKLDLFVAVGAIIIMAGILGGLWAEKRRRSLA